MEASQVHPTSMPDNSTGNMPANMPSHAPLLLASLISLMLVTGGANALVMVCTRLDRTLRTVSNLYIFSLAVADAIVGFLVMAGMIVSNVYHADKWPLGQLACTAWLCLDYSCVTISMFHLCVIAHDRYVALVRPMVYQQERTARDAMIRLFIVWFVGLAVWIPAVIFSRHSLSQDLEEGVCVFKPNSYFVIVQAILVYYIPTIIMAFFYVRCLCVLHRKFNETASARPNITLVLHVDDPSVTPNSTATPSAAVLVPQQRRSSQSSSVVPVSGLRRQARYLRTFRTLGVVMLVFLLCWTPFCFQWPVTTFCEKCVPIWVVQYCYWSAYINSTINPFLYFLSNRDFRAALSRLFRCKKKTSVI